MLVLGVSGSLRGGSHNRRLLRAAAAELPSEATFELWRELESIPAYDEDVDRQATPAAVERFRRALSEADALLIATPEYNHSLPGMLKNALDWASRPFPQNALREKPVAVVGASTGLFGAVWAQAELRKVLTAIGARVVDEELPVGVAHEAFRPDGSLVDPRLQATLSGIVAELVHDAHAQAEVDRSSAPPERLLLPP